MFIHICIIISKGTLHFALVHLPRCCEIQCTSDLLSSVTKTGIFNVSVICIIDRHTIHKPKHIRRRRGVGVCHTHILHHCTFFNSLFGSLCYIYCCGLIWNYCQYILSFMTVVKKGVATHSKKTLGFIRTCISIPTWTFT